MAQKGITEIQLSQIVASTFNPRKVFVESELKELSDSILENGVISPIMVRPLKNNTYEIVYGERRYRASLLANKKTIPSIIRSLSDEQAFDLAVTENLQRKDVSPLEEAQAFSLLLKQGKNDVKSLAMRFGKSEVYIRLRIKLNSLIDDFKNLLLNDTINVTVANLLTEYSEEIQQEIYNSFFSDDVSSWNNWRDLSCKALQEKISNYSCAELDKFNFDKAECLNCQFNTANFSLFNHDAAYCKNRTCLSKKNCNYLLEQIETVQKDNSIIELIFNHSSNKSVVEILKEKGYELVESYNFSIVPTEPEKPEIEESEDEEEYKELIDSYNEELEEYRETYSNFKLKIEAGTLNKCLLIRENNIEIVYMEETPSESSKEEEPIDESTLLKRKYESKIVRNKEIAEEKITEDISKFLNTPENFTGEISKLEDNIIYYLMLTNLRSENFALIGQHDSRYYLDNEVKLEAIKSLSEEAKTAIKRDFILSNLKSGAFGTNPNAVLLKTWAKQHFADRIEEIEQSHYETYSKRNNKIEEKKTQLTK